MPKLDQLKFISGKSLFHHYNDYQIYNKLVLDVSVCVGGGGCLN